jgi:hypothetical protein
MTDPSRDEAGELIGRITAHHGAGWLAAQIGVSVRMLEQIRLGRAAAVPATVQRLRQIAQQGAQQVGEPMKYRVASDRRW